MSSDIAFDAILFDLDGTLAATDRFWPEAARAGARRAFVELGLERELPTHAEWMSMVGLTNVEGFALVFPDLDLAQRELVEARCIEEEQAALQRGGASFLPGVRETLDALRERGIRMGIASNCGRDYLDAMLNGLGLAEWIEAARCLDSPGVQNKADMIEDLLHTFGTRSAVMVGDRRGDRDAAWANGLPHIHLARGYAPSAETFDCEAVLEGMDALLPTLARRAAWLESTLDALDLNASVRTLGITGALGVGKTLFARDLARRVPRRRVHVVGLDAWGLLDPIETGPDPAHVLTRGYAVDELIRDVLLPHSRAQRVASKRAGGLQLEPEDLLILEGRFLLHPQVFTYLDRTLHLSAPLEVIERRIAGRDGRLLGARRMAELRAEQLPLAQAFAASYAPERADMVLTHASALGGDAPTATR